MASCNSTHLTSSDQIDTTSEGGSAIVTMSNNDDVEEPTAVTSVQLDLSASGSEAELEENLTTDAIWEEGGRSVSFSNSTTPKPLGKWSASFIIVNFISMGYILNPAAFAQGGTLLASVCLALISTQSVITGIFILEACTRAEMFKVSMSAAFFQGQSQQSLQVQGNAAEVAQQSIKYRRYLPPRHSLRVHQRTFELSELCRIFMGRWMRNLFTATSAGDLYGITWALAVVFGSSLSEHLPFGTDHDYQLYLVIFMAIAVPMSCMRISAQMGLQIMFLVARTVMLLLMVGTLIGAYAANDAHFGSQQHPAKDVPVANFSSLVTVLQLCVFSTAYQFSVPGVTSETKNKGAMVGIIGRSVTYIFATNVLVGLMVAIYFGSATESSANLNWLNYHGGTWDGQGEVTRAWWATAISSYIVLFAALDGLAVYPLICISLGDILMGACYEDKVHDIQENWKIRIAFRLMACVPQAIGSMFLTNLGSIAKIAGIFTIMSYTVCPAYLAIRSRKAVQDAKLPTTTRYTTIFSSNNLVPWILIILSCALIVGVFVDAYQSFAPDEAADSTTATSAEQYDGTSTIPDNDLF